MESDKSLTRRREEQQQAPDSGEMTGSVGEGEFS